MNQSISLNKFIHKFDQPCVFKDILEETTNSEISKNSAISWTPDNLVELLKNQKLTFRVGKKNLPNIEFENECRYVNATVREFIEWKNAIHVSIDSSNQFNLYDINEYWAYADYKYMIEMIDSSEESIDECCIDWSAFGFSNRNARDSTMWLGTKEAYTPCHFDTYGYNLVAQIYGTKRWIMFPKADSEYMYPTRIPFEESTVYSKINIRNPNTEEFPKFKKSRPYIVDLNPGDVLYVPNNWWHYVESLTDSISINTWVELKTSDNLARVKEIVSKTLMQGLMESNFISFENWINSSEDYNTQAENIEILKESLQNFKTTDKLIEEGSYEDLYSLIVNHKNFSRLINHTSFETYLEKYIKLNSERSTKKQKSDYTTNLINDLSESVTDPRVVELIVQNLLEKI